MQVQSYGVTGMTCGHCVHAVSSEIGALPGVTDVAVELAAGGTSTVRVTSEAPLTDEQIATALDEAGDYHLAGA
jgi:copper chaperone CopZ